VKQIIFISLISLLIVSCTPQRRLARLIRKHPELSQEIVDTLKIDTLLYVPAKEASLHLPSTFPDTITRIENGIKIKFWNIPAAKNDIDSVSKNDSLGIKITIPEDSITFTKNLTYVKSSVSASNEINNNYLVIAVIIFLIIILIILIALILKKLFN